MSPKVKPKSATKPKTKSTPLKKSTLKKKSKGDSIAASGAKSVQAELLEADDRAELEDLLLDQQAYEAGREFASAEIDANIDQELENLATKEKKRLPKQAMAKAAATKSESALTTIDPVTAYLAEIRKYPLLTKEDEQKLARLYRETGDPKAAEQLVTSNLRFVVKVAAEYTRFGAKLIDLIQEGNVGLMHAVREFNPYKGVRLITYAVWWIRGYIQEYLMRQYSMVRIGTTQNQRKLFYRLQKERDALRALGHQPNNVALLAGRLGVSEEEVETMSQRMSGRDVSLNTPIDGENSTASLLDVAASNDTPPDEAIGREEEVHLLKKNIDKIRPNLSEKELYILETRLLADEPLTLQEIGEHFKITREAVRQLEVRLMNKIRSAVNESMT